MHSRHNRKTQKDAKILIIAPTSLIYNWKNEFDKFGSELKYKVCAENKTKRCYIASCDLDADAEELKKYILENTDIKEEYIKVGYIDKTMSCCCGPKTIAIFCG